MSERGRAVSVLRPVLALSRSIGIRNWWAASWFQAVLALLVMGSLLLGACRGAGALDEVTLAAIEDLSPANLDPGAKVQLIATTSLLAEVLREVGQDHVDLEVLMPPGADPHAFQISGRELARVAAADLVVVNGFGLEESLLRPMASAANGPIVSLSEGIEPLLGEPHGDHAGEGEHEQGEEEDEGSLLVADPHVWLDPATVLTWSQNTAEALAVLDPDHEQEFRRNAAAYAEELAELDRWIEAEISNLPPGRRVLVSDHQALAYFADRYGFELIGTVSPSTSSLAEPSAAELAELQDRMRARGVRAIFVSKAGSSRAAELLGEDLEVPVVALYLGALGPAGSPASDYASMMRFNVSAIVAALAD